MTEKKKTTEELFLIKIYELASASGDPEHEIDRYKIGAAIGMHTRSVDNIVQLLVRNNFLKRGDGSLIYLTPLGIRFLQDNKLVTL